MGPILLAHQGPQDNELYQNSEQISKNTQIIKQIKMSTVLEQSMSTQKFNL